MKIDTGLTPHAMTPYQHFFLGCWFNLCHEESLDSDRVSVLNPLIGVQELLALYEFGTNFGGDKKRVDVGLELYELLSKNTLLDHPHYKSLKADLVEQLKPYGKKNDSCNVNSNKELISSLIRELISLLEQHYIQDAFDALEEAAAATPGTSEEQMCDWQKTILLASDQLASALIANGAGLQDLFAFYRHILTKRQDIRPFADKFAAFRKAATNAPVNHEVTFVLRSDGLARVS